MHVDFTLIFGKFFRKQKKKKIGRLFRIVVEFEKKLLLERNDKGQGKCDCWNQNDCWKKK